MQGCLIRDSDHVTPGSTGFHVRLIQAALMAIDGAFIDAEELAAGTYGRTTADAVLAYKQARGVINRAYQNTADRIVGKMTIASIDAELVKLQEAAARTGPKLPKLEHEPPSLYELDAKRFVRLSFDKAHREGATASALPAAAKSSSLSSSSSSLRPAHFQAFKR